MAHLLFIALGILPCLVTGLSVSLLQKQQTTNQEEEEIPWYQNISMFHFPSLYSQDVQGPQLLSSVANSTAEYILVEFYAPWCPHCQHFAPEYERLSLAIQKLQGDAASKAPMIMTQGDAAVKAPKILTAKVDCVRFASTCNEWNVNSYPTLRWGKRSDWLTAGAPQQLEMIEVQGPLDAGSVAGWINDKLSIRLVPEHVRRSDLIPVELKSLVRVQQAQSQQAGVWDSQLAAALLIRIALERGALEGQKKDALLNFVDLLAQHFPDADGQMKCKKSFKALSTKLHGLGTSSILLEPDVLEKSWQPCGVDYSNYAQGWRACRGTWPNNRGFTCGLWSLIHTLSAHSEDKTAKRTFESLHDTVEQFFSCRECREHFLQIPRPSMDKPITRKGMQLWWWNAHNIVNRRVMKIEAESEDADPGFPKLSWWPSKETCTTCRGASGMGSSFMATWKVREPASVDDAKSHEGFDLAEVGSFMDRFYGVKSSA